MPPVQIEFPSILLPEGIKSGSIVDISVSRNHAKEATKEKSFRDLQEQIWETFGKHTPKPPVLRCRNATQTSVVLEWDPLDLATAKLRSLSLYRNGEKMANIPDALNNTSTKISGLAIDSGYKFQLELRTSSGMYRSELLAINTHKMTELSGITVTPGILPAPLRTSLVAAVERVGGKITETVRLDTTHFVCTEGRGREWERAREGNVPVVRPEWVEGCEREGRMVGVKDYYLDANPKFRQVGQGVGLKSGSPAPQTQAPRPAPLHEQTSTSALPQRPNNASEQSIASQTSQPSHEPNDWPDRSVPNLAIDSPSLASEPPGEDEEEEEEDHREGSSPPSRTRGPSSKNGDGDEEGEGDVGDGGGFDEVEL